MFLKMTLDRREYFTELLKARWKVSDWKANQVGKYQIGK